MSKVAVAILNWNGLAHLQTYLADLVIHSEQATIYLIDNGSTDSSIDWVTKHFPVVVIIALDKNFGFCEGYNRGLAQLKEPYFILLNSDVLVTAQWIAPLLQLMESQPSTAACQPKILDVSTPDQFEYAGASGGFLDHLGFPFCRGRIFQTLEKDIHQYNTNRSIHWASGAALMIRSTLFRAHGGFDSRFFAHMEEIDLCWRLRCAGHDIMACPESVVYHLGGGTLATDNPRKTFLNVRNNLMMLSKNVPRQKKWKVLFQKLLLDGIAGIYFLAQGKWQNTLAIIKGHFAFYTSPTSRPIHLPSEKYKGKAYASLYHQSIVWAYYVRGKKRYSDLMPSLEVKK